MYLFHVKHLRSYGGSRDPPKLTEYVQVSWTESIIKPRPPRGPLRFTFGRRVSVVGTIPRRQRGSIWSHRIQRFFTVARHETFVAASICRLELNDS